jgi:threonine aldolase
LCERLSDCRNVRPTPPETNIVMIELLRDEDTSDTVLPRLERAGVRLVAFGAKRIRAVTHLDATTADVETAGRVIAEVIG